LLFCLVAIKLKFQLDTRSKRFSNTNAYTKEIEAILDLHEKRVLGWTDRDDARIIAGAKKLLKTFAYPEQEEINKEIANIIKELKANAVEPSP